MSMVSGRSAGAAVHSGCLVRSDQFDTIQNERYDSIMVRQAALEDGRMCVLAWNMDLGREESRVHIEIGQTRVDLID